MELGSDINDEHVHDLARRCREIEAKTLAESEKMQSAQVIGSDLRKTRSTDEQEEVEK